MFTKYYVWLYTVPDKQEGSRIEQYLEAGREIIWPDITCRYLFDYLMQVGPCQVNGMGQVAIGWQELESWQKQQGLVLNPWELSIIRKASAAYAEQAHLSSKPDCPPPGKVVDQDPKDLAKHIKGILR